MRALALVLGLAVAGCSTKWPYVDPAGAKRLSTDARLGFIVAETGPQLPTFVDLEASTGKLMVGLYVGEGVDVDLQRTEARLSFSEVDPVTGASTPLPAPMLTPTSDLRLSTVLADKGLLYSSTRTREVAFFDGTGWTRLPDLPAGVGASRSLAARSATEVVLRTQDTVWVVKGGAWKSVYVGQQVVFGPWSASGLTLVTHPGQLCLSTLDVGQGTVSAETCEFTNAGTLVEDAFNGTPSEFQLLTFVSSGTGYAWHFQAGHWRAGELVSAARVSPTWKSDALVAVTSSSVGDLPIYEGEGGLVALRDGVQSMALAPPFSSALSCACTRATDASCDCARRPLVTALELLPDASAAFVFGVSTADAKRQVFVRRLTLPDTKGFDPATCSPTCMAQQVCAFKTPTDTACIIDPTSHGSGRLEQNPVVSLTVVTPFDGTQVTVELSHPDGGAADDAKLVTLPPALSIRAAPNQPLRITLSANDHAPRVIVFTMPDPLRTAELGPVYLPRGLKLGLAPPGLGPVTSTTAVLPTGGAMALAVGTDDGGVRWELLAERDGGLERTVLRDAASAPRRARVDPAGRFFFLPGASGLALLDAHTLQPLGELPGTDWDLGASLFAAGADVLAVQRGGPSPSPAATEVLAFSATGLTSRFQVSTPGTVEALSADGTAVLRKEGSAWVVHTALGAFTPSTLGQGPLLSADGTHVYSQQGAVVPFTLLDHSADGGTATVSTVATFAVVPTTGGLRYSEYGPGSTGILKQRDGDGATSVLVDGGISGIALGVPRLGVLYTQPPAQQGPSTSQTAGYPDLPGGSLAFSERDTGEVLALAGCSGCQSLVLARGAPPRPVYFAGVPVFGAGNDRALVGRAIAPIDPVTHGPRSPATPFAPMQGPAPVLDGRFTFSGDPRQDALGMPCAPYAYPSVRYQVASDGKVTSSPGPDGLYCVR
ncbi:MAG: hypothetical protein K1X89_11365 [Myxococcaceae bacterium]|nr:hypothetical protein [Myxococcaceae bacterium]